MKTLVRCSLLAVAASFTLPAQTSSPVVKAKVPFEFTVMGRTMPAGEYVIDPANTAAVVLRCQERGASVIVPTDNLRSADLHGPGKLIFHRYGNQYFLSEVWGAEGNGRKLHETKVERDLALGVSPDRTVIAARR